MKLSLYKFGLRALCPSKILISLDLRACYEIFHLDISLFPSLKKLQAENCSSLKWVFIPVESNLQEIMFQGQFPKLSCVTMKNQLKRVRLFQFSAYETFVWCGPPVLFNSFQIDNKRETDISVVDVNKWITSNKEPIK
jgi:hypothetical protein